MTEEISLAYSNLSGVLEDEIKIYRSLLELVRREKEILIEAKIPELEEN
ncbi:MAG: hypothetical protein IPM57_07955 [Oligoflexia bacterium]|nr:hypothetical protein [Oligoflexia bacterium]